MASKQAGWNIYKQQMGLLDHGDALWEPAPIYSYRRVQLGDVGYIRRGRFHLLFSAGCPLGARQLGVDVPLTFESLDVGPIIYSQPRLPGYLCTNTVKDTGGGLGTSVSTTPFLEPGASFSFELTERQGAALVTKYRTYREDIELESAFEEYTKRNYDSWVTFARNARHGNDIKPVLVTGVDMTRDFAMMAYSNNSTRLSSEFTTSIPLLASASATAWGTWHTQGLVHTNCGPQLCSPPSSPHALDLPSSGSVETTPNEYNQCVFIRYYTMRKRALMFPKVIKATAGPHDLGSGSNYDETLPELAVQSSSDSDTGSDIGGDSMTDYSSSITSYEQELEVFHNVSSEGDTFDIIADYIFQNSEAEAVLVHHRDITQIRGGVLGSEMAEIFSHRQPAIAVSRDGVGRLVHQTNQLAVTSPRKTSPYSAVAPRHTLSGFLFGQSSDFLIHLNEEDAWVLSRGLLLLLASSKKIDTISLDVHALDQFSHVQMSETMLIGTAGIAGMFAGQSIRLSKSLLPPLNLLPSSWQVDPMFVQLRSRVPEGDLLLPLAQKHLGVMFTVDSSQKPPVWGDIFPSNKYTGRDNKRDGREHSQRYSLPQHVGVGRRDYLVPRRRSLWFKPQKSTQGEPDPTLRRWIDPLPATGDLDANSPRNSWRHSYQSVTSNGDGSIASLRDPWSQLSRSSDRFSLGSNGSSSSVLTRSSDSTLSTLLTAPASGTISWRSSRGSVFQREKRFSNVKLMDETLLELDEASQLGTPPSPETPTSGSSSPRLLNTTTLRRASGDGGSTHTTGQEQGVLSPPPKLHGRKYAASLTSLLRKRESSDDAGSACAVPENESPSLGRRARFKRFLKDAFKI